jgi:hypothetical protein
LKIPNLPASTVGWVDFSSYPLIRGVRVMAMPVVEFSREGYKIRRFLAKNQHMSDMVKYRATLSSL